MQTLLNTLCDWVGLLPVECMKYRFMQEAFLGILLCAPLSAAAGIHVVNFRMSFFSDAIGHSTFAGVALGLIFAVSPDLTMPLLALVSRNPNVSRDMQMFLYGDILTISRGEILALFALSCVFFLFQGFAFNRMIAIGLNEQLARTHRVHVAFYEYVHVALLSLVVIFCVKAVGVLLVTALLIVPAAAARNLSKSSGAMFWISILIGVCSGIAGLLISAQEWAGTAAGATIVLFACLIFILSMGIGILKTKRN